MLCASSAVGCREFPVPAEADADLACGPAPSNCSIVHPTNETCGSTLCGEFYVCQCIEDLGEWAVTIYDCYCFDCTPVTQQHCEQGEKCGQLVESGDPFLAKTTCLPNGTRGDGDPCSFGEPGATTGFDDCVAGYHCNDGTCAQICAPESPDQCQGKGESCITDTYKFGDEFGVCAFEPR
tara:strand:+ start:15143 stop:15682 length:540 start_codon:yes stop_codon:yes gene_type:complete